MLFDQVGCGLGSSAADDARGGSRGQSEVIGAILTVAIVVILGALVGQYVFGLDIIQAGEQNVGPQISFDTTVESNDDLTIEHQSGSSAETSELTISSDSGTILDSQQLKNKVDEEWTASESITISNTNPNLKPGETVRIIWESSTTGDSTVILKYEYTP
ncbi:type IV pilin [Haloglomus salinum]|jgi:flagellin-like protein|uniref:type IV pilin n=1 Tax=Haloglomus salinum TaxID=2962673 RepID=UPI0020C9EB57|nr:type IV pilin N-terminal domain-containing protein [Haloglomus salinum]